MRTADLYNVLSISYPDRVLRPDTLGDIPAKQYLVYILAHNNIPIVVGHGQKNRASILFDSLERNTPNHMKGLLVRIYNLNCREGFSRFMIVCNGKAEAKVIEKELHKVVGGNSCELPDFMLAILYENVKNDLATLLLKLAVCSYYDGLADLKKWRRKGLIEDEIWEIISEKLQLERLGWH